MKKTAPIFCADEDSWTALCVGAMTEEELQRDPTARREKERLEREAKHDRTIASALRALARRRRR